MFLRGRPPIEPVNGAASGALGRSGGRAASIALPPASQRHSAPALAPVKSANYQKTNEVPIVSDEKIHGRILIVDDEEINLDLFSMVLAAEGNLVFKARDGVDALEKFEKVAPDLVLLDLAMPRLNGYAVCSHLRRTPEARNVPILIVTGIGELENRKEAYQVGADDFLTKPVSELELGVRVQALLRLRSYKLAAERHQAAAAATLAEITKIRHGIVAARDAALQSTSTRVAPPLEEALAACLRLESQLAKS